MTLVGWAQIALVLALVAGLRHTAQQIHCGRLRGRKKLSQPRPRTGRARLLPLGGGGPGARAGLVRLYARDARFLRCRLSGSLRRPEAPGPAAVESARLRWRGAGSRLQHGDQLHHQHQLAELCRRDDDEPSDPDGRPHRAQFRLRGDRPRDGLRAGARLCALLGDHGRQFLGRSDPDHALHSAADRSRWRVCADRARRAADARPDRSTQRRWKARNRPSRWGRWRARRSSRSLAPTAAAFSTPIRPIRSRTPTPGPTSSRSGRSC